MAKNKIPENLPLPVHSTEWNEGWKAFNEGKDLHNNPYSAIKQPRKYMSWQMGWDAAKYQNSK